MQSRSLTVVLCTLWLSTLGVDSQEVLLDDDLCSLSNLQVAPCRKRTSTIAPEPHQYAIYRTSLVEGGSGLYECRYRDKSKNPDNEIIVPIENLSTDDLRYLYSPGLLLEKDYVNQMLVEFNVQCPEGRNAYFNTTNLAVEGTCQGVCVDYVEVDRGDYGISELCDNNTANQFPLEQGSFTFRFRTSRRNRNTGFQTYVICYDPQKTEIEGCTRIGPNGTVVVDETAGDNRRRRKRELEDFHNGWQERLKRASPNIRFAELIIQIDDMVIFNSSTISVIRDGEVISRFRGVVILYTLDLDGFHFHIREGSQINEDNVKEFILFNGPGPMQIVGRHAYFQQFSIDPRGVLPTPEEEVSLDMMTSAVLDVAPVEAEANITREEFPTIDGTLPPTPPTGRIGRRQTDDVISEEALKEALRTKNACNPVLRTASGITLQVARNEAFHRGEVEMFEELLKRLQQEIDDEMVTVDDGSGQDTTPIVPGDP